MPFDGTQLSDATQVLIKGRRRIEAGWCQGSYRTIDDRFCMVGALREHAWATPAHRYLARAVKTSGLPVWNDTPGRTKEEVLAAYDRAIELSMRS